MSIGRRDGQLLALRERLVGDELDLQGECPSCNQPVELALTTPELGAAGASGAHLDPGARHRLEHGDMEIEFRLPDSADLEAVGLCADVETARRQLLDRCVLLVKKASANADLAGSQLPGDVQTALEQEMDRLDPLAITRVDLSCPRCRARWEARIDISDIVLSELSARAHLLLRDVSTLARLYHWSEQSILQMSARRRSAYLELAGS